MKPYEMTIGPEGYLPPSVSERGVVGPSKGEGLVMEKRAPALAIGDGALGFWAAVHEVWPETREQRCWVHRIANVLDKLPTRLQPQAKRALHEMMYAERRASCEAAMQRFAQDYEAKYPKAVKALFADVPRLLTHFDFPAAHWKHIRTTNPIESTFATVKLRTSGGTDDGVQAAGGRAEHVASARCAQPASARSRRRGLQGWAVSGTNGSTIREELGKGRRLITLIHNS